MRWGGAGWGGVGWGGAEWGEVGRGEERRGGVEWMGQGRAWGQGKVGQGGVGWGGAGAGRGGAGQGGVGRSRERCAGRGRARWSSSQWIPLASETIPSLGQHFNKNEQLQQLAAPSVEVSHNGLSSFTLFSLHALVRSQNFKAGVDPAIKPMFAHPK